MPGNTAPVSREIPATVDPGTATALPGGDAAPVDPGPVANVPFAGKAKQDMPDEFPEPRRTAPAGRRQVARRASSFGITLVVVAALLFFARDLVPPGIAERLAARVGLPDMAWMLSSAVGRGPASDVNGAALAGEGRGGVAANPVYPGGGVGEPASAGTGLADPAGLPMEPEQRFAIQFPSDSDLLDYDAWITLDRAAALLREQPELIAMIAYESDQSMDRLSSRELAMVRIAAVESYLVTAGVDLGRLRRESLPSPGGDPRTDAPSGRFITIAIGSRTSR